MMQTSRICRLRTSKSYSSCNHVLSRRTSVVGRCRKRMDWNWNGFCYIMQMYESVFFHRIRKKLWDNLAIYFQLFHNLSSSSRQQERNGDFCGSDSVWMRMPAPFFFCILAPQIWMQTWSLTFTLELKSSPQNPINAIILNAKVRDELSGLVNGGTPRCYYPSWNDTIGHPKSWSNLKTLTAFRGQDWNWTNLRGRLPTI